MKYQQMIFKTNQRYHRYSYKHTWTQSQGSSKYLSSWHTQDGYLFRNLDHDHLFHLLGNISNSQHVLMTGSNNSADTAEDAPNISAEQPSRLPALFGLNAFCIRGFWLLRMLSTRWGTTPDIMRLRVVIECSFLFSYSYWWRRTILVTSLTIERLASTCKIFRYAVYRTDNVDNSASLATAIEEFLLSHANILTRICTPPFRDHIFSLKIDFWVNWIWQINRQDRFWYRLDLYKKFQQASALLLSTGITAFSSIWIQNKTIIGPYNMHAIFTEYVWMDCHLVRRHTWALACT